MGNVIYCTDTHIQSFAYGDGAYRGCLPHQEMERKASGILKQMQKKMFYLYPTQPVVLHLPIGKISCLALNHLIYFEKFQRC